jgi:WD40 repeat protein
VHRRLGRLKSCDGAAASQAIGGQAGACTALAWHPFSEFLASCSPEPDSGPTLHDLRDGACLHSYKGHRAPVTHARFAPDGRLLASADADGRVLVRPSRLGRRALVACNTPTSRLGSCLAGHPKHARTQASGG